MRSAGALQEFDQLLQFVPLQMPQLPLVALTDRGIQLGEQFEPRVGDADQNDPAIVFQPQPRDQAAVFELVEQSGDVRRAGDESARKAEGGQPLGASAAEQAQGVVLLGRQVVLAEQLVFEHAQAIIRPPEIEECLLLQRIEMADGTA